VIWHKLGQSSGGAGSRLQQYYQTRNRILLTFKHGPWRAKLVAVKLMCRWLLKGNSAERQGVLDFLFRKFGKQAIV
jgi:hypothetical protein